MDAIKKVHKDCSMWHVRYATIHEIAAAGLLSPFATTLNREDGHIVVSVYIDPRQQDRQFFENTDQFVDHVISTFGHRRSCYRISVDGASVLEYRVEYFNIHNAAHALSSLDNLLLDVRMLLVVFGSLNTDLYSSLCDLMLPFATRMMLARVTELELQT
jgi:hypothetical protein